MEVFETLDWYQRLVRSSDEVIAELFERTGSAELKDLLRRQHHGGKRLRPFIVGASAQLVGEPHPALPYASAAIELFHMATLFHDDVIDETTTRRHHLSGGRQVGNTRSILAGDYLLAESLDLFVGKTTADITQDFLTTLRTMVKSEIQAARNRWNLDLRRSEYLNIIESKTAVLFEFSASIGCRLGGADAEIVRHTGAYGHEMGMAYQLVDDLHDMMGLLEDGDHDLKNGYLPLPMIDLLQALPEGERDAARRQILAGESDGYRELIQLMKSFSIFPSVLSTIRLYLNRAEAHLGALTQCPVRDGVIPLLSFLVNYLRERATSFVQAYERLGEERAVSMVAVGE